MSRGFQRQPIFLEDKDRFHFLEWLGKMVERCHFLIHAYVLMPNHCHLLVQTPQANRHGDWGRDLALHVGRHHHGMTLRGLGQHAGISPFGVSPSIHRFGQKMSTHSEIREMYTHFVHPVNKESE